VEVLERPILVGYDEDNVLFEAARGSKAARRGAGQSSES